MFCGNVDPGVVKGEFDVRFWFTLAVLVKKFAGPRPRISSVFSVAASKMDQLAAQSVKFEPVGTNPSVKMPISKWNELVSGAPVLSYRRSLTALLQLIAVA